MTESHIYFNSGAARPLNLLSNLNEAPIELTLATVTPELLAVNPKLNEWVEPGQTLHFRTIEHLWHALKALDRATFFEFVGPDGRFARFDAAAFEPVFPGNGEGKHRYWAAKQNSGIVPKLASNRKHGKKLGIEKSMRYEREMNAEGVQRAVWKDLLTRKYIANKAHREALLATGDKTLVEFARGASASRPEFWGGCVRDGVLYGQNFMGKMVQEVREWLKRQ